MIEKPKIIAISGSTASGKTEISIKLCRLIDGEIVNTDSRQIYKYLDIGTGKEKIIQHNPDGTVIINGIIHHLIDIIDPKEEFNLAKFKELALQKINKIHDKGKTPILSGGTGLYTDSILHNYDLKNETTDYKYRKRLAQKTVKELQDILKEKDPPAFIKMNKSDKNNKHRLIRAIEKTKYPTDKDLMPKEISFDYVNIAINMPLKKLEKNIDKRVDSFFKNGLVEENKLLREKGYTTQMQALKSIGYMEFDDYFDGKISLEETKKLVKLHTRQYAKRQLTWLKRNKEVIWISNFRQAFQVVKKFLSIKPQL